jgi:hypothetical protein
MPITFLRFQPGAAGDTVLKCIIDSHTRINCQMKYTNNVDGKTEIDETHLRQFRYNQISNLSFQYFKTDELQLKNQLLLLENEDVSKEWLLKSHYYGEVKYPVIDIIIGKKMLPFVVRSILKKRNTHPNYLPLIAKITNKKILYQFNCYNYAIDRITTEQTVASIRCLQLEDILSGWDNFCQALAAIDLPIGQNCKSYYDQWLENNLYLPSSLYCSLVDKENFDYNNNRLAIEERYCLMALSGEKFKIL